MRILKDMYKQYGGLSRSAYVIFFARIVTTMGGFIWPLLTLILSQKIGYSATEIALISVVIALVFIPGNIIGGKLADRFSRKKIIIIFDVISVGFFFACAMTEPGHLMTVLFVLAGLFATMEGPAFEALVADASKPAEREKVFSLTYLGHNLGFIIGAAVGGLLFKNHLPLAFVLDGITTLISTALILAYVKEDETASLEEAERNEYEHRHEEKVSGLEILKERKPLAVQILIFSLTVLVYDQWSFVLPLFMGSLFGENGGALFGFMASFNGFIVILFTPILTKLLERFSELPKIMIGIALYSASYMLLRGTQAYGMILFMMFVFTLGEITNMLGRSPYISRRVPASHRGRISSYNNIGAFIGGIVGRFIMGLMIDRFSFSAAFTTLGFLGALGIVLVMINYRYDRRVFPKLYRPRGEEVERAF